MTAEHNHPPRCCCPVDSNSTYSDIRDATPAPNHRCPACPEHGDLAPTVECPQCHQPAGRPHTDYCTLNPDRVWAGLGSGPGYPAGDTIIKAADHPNDWTATLARNDPAGEDGPICRRCGWPAGHHAVINAGRAGGCPCRYCGLLDGDHKGGCPATGEAPAPGAPG